jgi:hypothetical protein
MLPPPRTVLRCAAADFAVLGLIAAILLAIGAWLFSKIEA